MSRLKFEQGIYDEEFYHYDTPLTKEHELQVLKEAGFSSIKILAEWGTTATYYKSHKVNWCLMNGKISSCGGWI